MAVITLHNGVNVNALTLYDFLDQNLASVSTTQIIYELPFGGSHIYRGLFEFDLFGNALPHSRITAIDSLATDSSPLWSLSDFNLPVSVYETHIESDAIIGINASASVIEYILRGDDQLSGSDAPDSAVLFTGNDSFMGFEGNDFVNGHFGQDLLNGHSGNDVVRGGADADTVRGGADNDIVRGDKGNDQILGDMGNDTLYGGEGADQFIFKPASGSDVIADFEDSDQLIIYMRSTVLDISDITISVSRGDTLLELGMGETITLLDYDQFSVENITLVA